MKMKKLHIFITIGIIFSLFMAGRASGQEKVTSAKANTETHMIAAEAAYTQQKYKEAMADCVAALESNPNNDAAYYLMAKISLQMNKAEDAENFCKKAAQLDTSNYYYAADMASIYLLNNKVDEARNLYEKMSKKYPGKSEIFLNLINIYSKTNDYDKVFGVADRLEKIAGPNEVSTMAKFDAYSAKRQYSQALKCLEDADAVAPNPKYETLLGDMNMDRMNDTLALKYYSKALVHDTAYAPALFGKAELYRLRNDYPNFFKFLNPFMANKEINPKMKTDYLKQIFNNGGFLTRYKEQMAESMQIMAAANPDDTTCNQIAAIYLSGAGHKDEARKILENSIKYYPNTYSVNIDYMSFLYSAEEWRRLKNFGDSAISKFPGKTDMLQFKGLAEYNLKLYDSSIATLSQVEKISKERKDTTLLLNAYSLIGDLYHLKNQNEETYKYYKKALKINPKESPVLNNWAWYIATSDKNGNLNKALEMSKKTIELEPDNTTYLDTYGWILYLQGNYPEARKQFQHAMAYGGSDNPVMLDHYAEVLFALKEYDLAFLYWDKAVEAAKKEGDTAQTDKLLKKIEGKKEMSKK
jgi:tetratricopeptide (TPR) repeat protein